MLDGYRTLAATGEVLGISADRVRALIDGPLIGRVVDGELVVHAEDLAAFRRPRAFEIATTGDNSPPRGSEVLRSASVEGGERYGVDASLTIGLCGGSCQARRGTMASKAFRALSDVDDVRRQSERFFRYVTPEPNTGCHLWVGSSDRRSGYGYFRLWPAKITASAHRVSWVIANGRLPERHDVDHLCHHRWCVNDRHLEAVPHAENIRRRDANRAALGLPDNVAIARAVVAARHLALVSP